MREGYETCFPTHLKKEGINMAHDSEEAVIQNLKDAGCNQDTIDQFVECLEHGTLEEQLRILSQHRSKLLDQLHIVQRRIDCLDYLVYQIERHKIAI